MAVAVTSPVLTQRDPKRSEVALELIDDHAPLLLVRWSGNVQPQQVLRLIRFFDVHVEAAPPNQRLVHICDARDAAMPSALVRDMLVDWLSDRPRRPGAPAMRSIIVADDPMIRGVVASLRWATGRGDSLQAVSTIEQGIVGAREAFIEIGQPIPDALLDEA